MKRLVLTRPLLDRLTFRRADDCKPRSLACSNDGLLVAVGTWGGRIHVWDTRRWKLVAQLPGHDSYVTSVAFLDRPGGAWLVSGAGDETVRVWDPMRSAEVRCLRGHTHRVTAVACCPRLSRIISGSHDDTERLWEAESGEELQCFAGHGIRVERVAFSPDGRRFASGDVNGRVLIWDAAVSSGAGHQIKSQKWTTSLGNLRFSSDGRYLLYALDDLTAGTTLRLHSAADARLLTTLAPRGAHVGDFLIVPPRNDVVAFRLKDLTAVGLWEIASGAVRFLQEQGDEVASLVCSPDGRFLAAGRKGARGKRGSLRVWQLPDGEEWVTFPGNAEAIETLCFSPDGALIASRNSSSQLNAETDPDLYVWDVQRKRPLHRLKGHAREIIAATFSPDGRNLASASYDETVRVWDTRTGEPVHCFTETITPVGVLAFSDDGQRLAARSARTLQPELVWVWDLHTGRPVDLQEGLTDVTFYTRLRGPCCFVRREGGQRVLLVLVPCGHLVASVESDFDLGQTHPSGQAWAWRNGRQLNWFRLEAPFSLD